MIFTSRLDGEDTRVRIHGYRKVFGVSRPFKEKKITLAGVRVGGATMWAWPVCGRGLAEGGALNAT